MPMNESNNVHKGPERGKVVAYMTVIPLNYSSPLGARSVTKESSYNPVCEGRKRV